MPTGSLWSHALEWNKSAHTHLGLAQDPLLFPHPVHLALGADRTARADAWRTWLRAPMGPDELARIRTYMDEKALGDLRFQSMMEKALNRPVTVRPRGGRRENRR